MSRWSKLKKEVDDLMDPKLKFQIYCNAYNIGEALPIPRFWITISREIVWDWPKDFIEQDGWYFYNEAKNLSQLLRVYIDTPVAELLSREYDDRFKLVPLLLVCDRRIGKRRLNKMLEEERFAQYADIIFKRLNKEPKEPEFLIKNAGSISLKQI